MTGQVGFIGAGNMARALARGWAKPYLFCDAGSGRARALAEEVGGKALPSAEEVVAASDVIILAHKPKELSAVAERVQVSGKIVVSLLARTSVADLRTQFPNANVVRVQPNIAVEIRRGVTLLAETSKQFSGPTEQVQKMFEDVGLVVPIAENLLDLAAACSGVTPAYVALIVEAQVEAVVRRGLPAATAEKLFLGSLEGTAALLQTPAYNTLSLRRAVASPGGTTAQGLAALERHGVRSAFAAAADAVVGND